MANKQKEIEREEKDTFEKNARVAVETSNDGKYSTYEIGLQWRGEPKKD